MSKVIRGERAENARRWPLPRVGGGSGIGGLDGALPERPMPTHRETIDATLEALSIREQAHREGFNEGYEEGMQAARAETTAVTARLRELLSFLERPVEALDHRVEEEMLELALAVSKQILRREIRTDPRHIIGLIREAIKQLPANLQDISVHLHPDDASVIREALHEHPGKRRWKIVDDPGVSKGDCKITTETSYVDAGIDGLIARLAAELLGGHRTSDGSERGDVGGDHDHGR
ncbi:MAG: flagellar assembly protein FliH [Thiotrichales bacterium]